MTYNWRPTRASVGILVGHMKKAVAVKKPDVIIFQLLDIALYQVRGVVLTAPQPTSRGTGMVATMWWDLLMVPKTAQVNIYNAIKSVLAA